MNNYQLFFISISMKKLNILTIIILLLLLTSCKKQAVVTSNIYVDAESYVVMDATTHRVLDGRNIHSKMLPASITKILTCITVLNNFSIDDLILITQEMTNIDGSRIYLEVGDVVTVEDLLYGLMLSSGNDASIALALGLTGSIDNFTYLMNEQCKIIGMKNSTFENPNGLDEETKNYTTAYDMGLLMSYCLQNPTFRKITSTKEYKTTIISGKNMYFHNKHKLIQNNSLVTGGKTGYTKKAGRTLVSSFKKDTFEIVICTMNSSNDWEAHEQLANKAFNDFDQISIISLFALNNNLINYGKYSITNKDLLFPLRKDENKKDFKIKLNLIEKDVIIKYYKEEELITTFKLENRKLND